jgi:hypothetical protein
MAIFVCGMPLDPLCRAEQYPHCVLWTRMLECAWSCWNTKLGLQCQQYSNKRSSIVYGSDFGCIAVGQKIRPVQHRTINN